MKVKTREAELEREHQELLAEHTQRQEELTAIEFAKELHALLQRYGVPPEKMNEALSDARRRLIGPMWWEAIHGPMPFPLYLFSAKPD